jgi:hypothetical protein
MLAMASTPTLSRRGAVMQALGVPTLLYPVSVPWRRRVPQGERVHVYVDVSGSLQGLRNEICGAVLDCGEFVHPVLHLFSTKVADVSVANLRRGVCPTTGGTDVGCVAEHIEQHRVRRAVIVTDGWVAPLRGAPPHARSQKARRGAGRQQPEQPRPHRGGLSHRHRVAVNPDATESVVRHPPA